MAAPVTSPNCPPATPGGILISTAPHYDSPGEPVSLWPWPEGGVRQLAQELSRGFTPRLVRWRLRLGYTDSCVDPSGDAAWAHASQNDQWLATGPRQAATFYVEPGDLVRRCWETFTYLAGRQAYEHDIKRLREHDLDLLIQEANQFLGPRSLQMAVGPLREVRLGNSGNSVLELRAHKLSGIRTYGNPTTEEVDAQNELHLALLRAAWNIRASEVPLGAWIPAEHRRHPCRTEPQQESGIEESDMDSHSRKIAGDLELILSCWILRARDGELGHLAQLKVTSLPLTESEWQQITASDFDWKNRGRSEGFDCTPWMNDALTWLETRQRQAQDASDSAQLTAQSLAVQICRTNVAVEDLLLLTDLGLLSGCAGGTRRVLTRQDLTAPQPGSDEDFALKIYGESP